MIELLVFFLLIMSIMLAIFCITVTTNQIKRKDYLKAGISAILTLWNLFNVGILLFLTVPSLQ